MAIAAVLALTIVSLFCMGAARTALAEGLSTLRLNSNLRHSYTAYCLLSGMVDGDSLADPSFEGAMSDAFYQSLTEMQEWDANQSDFGPRVVSNWLGRQIAADRDFSFTARLAKLADRSGSASFSFEANKDNHLNQGYWLVVGEGTMPICILVGPGSNIVNEKPSVPSSNKEVAKLQYDGSIGTYSDSIMAGVDDTLHYRIVGTLPLDYVSYDTYLYRFVDTMDTSIIVKMESVRIKVLKTDGTEKDDLTEKFTISSSDTPEGRVSLVASINNLKNAYPEYVQGDLIVLEYDANFNASEATLGYERPNINDAHIEYTRAPLADGVGRTRSHVAKVYSFELRVRKISSHDRSTVLSGAEFILQRDDKKYLTVEGTWSASKDAAKRFTTDKDGMFSVQALNLGDYSLVEVKAPEGYRPLSAPVNISLGRSHEQKRLSIKTASQSVTVESVDASSGCAIIQIENIPTGKTPPGGLFGILPQTSDFQYLLIAVVLVVVGMFTVGMGVMSRRHVEVKTPERIEASIKVTANRKGSNSQKGLKEKTK